MLRSMGVKTIFLILIWVLPYAVGGSPVLLKKKYADELVLAVTDLKGPVDSLFSAGYRGFLLGSDIQLSSLFFTQVNRFLTDNPSEFLVFIQQQADVRQTGQINASLRNKLVEMDGTEEALLCDSLLKYGKQVFFFRKTAEGEGIAAEKFLTHVRVGRLFPRFSEQVFETNPSENPFTLFRFDRQMVSEDPDTLLVSHDLHQVAVNFLQKTGKIPNFIVTNTPEEVNRLANTISFTLRLSIKQTNGNYLDGVRFDGFPLLETQGITHLYIAHERMDSVLYNKGFYTIVPQKDGYLFVPEIFTFNSNNFNLHKTILATELGVTTSLLFYLPLNRKVGFDSDFQNNIVYSKIDYAEEGERNFPASFDGKENCLYFNFREEEPAITSFSVCCWVKPENVNGNFPIFSKIGSYCLKIREGVLCFTAVDVADDRSEKSIVKTGVWQHIAFVYEKGKQMRFFVDGVLTDVRPALDYKVHDGNFALGTDQWNEFFNGKITELAMWSRAVGEEEIQGIYESGINLGSMAFPWKRYWIPAVLLLVLLAVVLLLLRYKRGGKNKQVAVVLPELVQMAVSDSSERKKLVHCFGNFAVYDSDGKNRLESLSAKKSSFLLVLIYYTLKEGGISSNALTDNFWPGYSPERSKNVRGTYVQELRSIFPPEILTVVHNRKKWSVCFGDGVECDLAQWFKLAGLLKQSGGKPPVEAYELFERIAGKGAFAENISNEFVDTIKQEVNDQSISILEQFLDVCGPLLEPAKKLDIINTLMKIDPVDETMFLQKIELLRNTGSQNDAFKCYQQFAKNWEKYYGEAYRKDFEWLK